MKADIRDRLRRLGTLKGVQRGAGDLKPGPYRPPDQPSSLSIPRSSAPAAQEPLWNLEQETEYGRAYVRRTRYPLAHVHGGTALARALSHPPHLFARLNNGAALDLRDAVFLDTETTGLSGGTGTLVFMVGLGYFEGADDGMPAPDAGRPGAFDEGGERDEPDDSHGSFVIDQYFLREPAEEAGMLIALDECIGRRAALVTFNGRGFDVPLLETRYTMARIAPALSGRSHLDLLMPARRAWRVELGSCSLSSLEAHMLDVRRDQQDIPGFLIPQLYREYLASGDPADMQRVMYHNLHDILSMVTLVTRLCSSINAPGNLGEYLAAGQYLESIGQLAEAEQTYATALTAVQNPNSESRRRVLTRMAACLKREDRREQAVPYWRQLADSGDLAACLELAKHYEWQAADLPQALAAAQAALALSRDSLTRREVSHRIERLQRKMA